MEHATVSEIHRYPLRPEGFEEPLFATAESRGAVAEHLLRAPWLVRASELGGGFAGGRTARARREPIQVEGAAGRGRGGGARIVRTCGRTGRRRGRRVAEVLDRWREVGGWWDGERAVDRIVFRVLLSDGAVVDLARERGEPGGWFLVGVAD